MCVTSYFCRSDIPLKLTNSYHMGNVGRFGLRELPSCSVFANIWVINQLTSANILYNWAFLSHPLYLLRLTRLQMFSFWAWELHRTETPSSFILFIFLSWVDIGKQSIESLHNKEPKCLPMVGKEPRPLTNSF